VKSVVKLLLACFAIAPLTRAAERPPMQHELMGVANGCFVESVAFLDAWHEKMGADAWAKMLRWGAREEDEVVAGHAVAVCEARGKLWCYDINFGWSTLAVDAAQRESVEAVVTPIVAKYPRIKAQFPSYFFDFPQEPAGAAPAAQLANLNPAVRDVTIVAERLARHRPVNAVKFTWGTGEEKHESAVAVFLYYGRFCVYSPENGTVPFRERAGVENLRVLRLALLRMFPGARDLAKL
jgi:hypothetical protein